VVDKSQWPPVVSTLTVTAITADENYPAGVPLGKVHASDFDPYDILVYSLIETQSSTHFTIDGSNGTLKSLTPLSAGTYELGVTVSDGRWTARGDAYIRIVTLASVIPDMKLDQIHFTPPESTGKGKGSSTTTSHHHHHGGIVKSRKDIGAFAVVITLKGHNPQSFLIKIFAFINEVKEAMDPATKGKSPYEVIILSVQSAKEEQQQLKETDNTGEKASSGKRSRRDTEKHETIETTTKKDASSSTPQVGNDKMMATAPMTSIPSVDILLAVRKLNDGSFVSPVELVKKLRFALPQIESVLSAKVTRLTFDICKEDSCERGQ
jgi:hypothetical protein